MGLKVKKISYDETKPFVLNIHYTRRLPSISYAFGMYEDDSLIGIVTFGSPASPSLCRGVAGVENSKNVLELNRLVFLDGFNKPNYASFLIGNALRKLPKNTFVVSYADCGGWQHTGYVYQATNFLFTGTTKPRTDMYSERGHSRHNGGDRSRRQLRTAKHRYVYLVGNKKRMLEQLKYKVLPYPKGESRRYDVSNPVPLVDTRTCIEKEEKQ